MKILFPIRAFYPHHGGGPSLSVYWLAKALAKEGNVVTVVTSTHGLDNKYPSDVWNNIDGINVNYCSTSWRFIYKSVGQIKGQDIIHLTSLCYLPSVIIAFILLFYKKRGFLWSPRGELAISAINGNSFKKAMFHLYGILFNRKFVFHGTSQKEIEEIHSFFNSCKTILIPNYLELSPKVVTNSTTHSLLYLGRISPIKSLDKLFEALSLSNMFVESDFIFLVAGKAVSQEEISYEQYLKKLVLKLNLRDKVSFIGEVDGHHKDELLSRSYFSFLVSETENFGNVVVEALAQGTPVVTSQGTPWQVLQEKRIGFNVDNNPTILSKIINIILSLPIQDYLEMRDRAYDFCQKEFSIQKNIGKWIEYYRLMVK